MHIPLNLFVACCLHLCITNNNSFLKAFPHQLNQKTSGNLQLNRPDPISIPHQYNKDIINPSLVSDPWNKRVVKREVGEEDDEDYYHSYYEEDSDGDVVDNEEGGNKQEKIKTEVAWAMYKLQQALDANDIDYEVRKLVDTVNNNNNNNNNNNSSSIAPKDVHVEHNDVFKGISGNTFLNDKTVYFHIKPRVSRRILKKGYTDVDKKPTERDVYVHVKESIMLSCFPAVVEMAMVSSINIEWKDNSNGMMDYNKLLIQRITLTNNQELWIKKSKEEDSGMYSCNVRTTDLRYKVITSKNLINIHVYKMAKLSLVQVLLLHQIDSCGDEMRKKAEILIYNVICNKTKTECKYKLSSSCGNSSHNLILSISFLSDGIFKTPKCSDSCILSHTSIHLSKNRINLSPFIKPLQELTRPKKLRIEENFIFWCPAGYFLYKFACSPCFRGTYVSKDGSNKECKPCPRNHYQPNVAATACMKCPEGTYTYGHMSRNYITCTTNTQTSFHSYYSGTNYLIFFIILLIFFMAYHIGKCVVRLRKAGKETIKSEIKGERIVPLYDLNQPFKITPMVLLKENEDVELNARALDLAVKEARDDELKHKASNSSSASSLIIFDNEKSDGINVSLNSKRVKRNRSSNGRQGKSTREKMTKSVNSFITKRGHEQRRGGVKEGGNVFNGKNRGVYNEGFHNNHPSKPSASSSSSSCLDDTNEQSTLLKNKKELVKKRQTPATNSNNNPSISPSSGRERSMKDVYISLQVARDQVMKVIEERRPFSEFQSAIVIFSKQLLKQRSDFQTSQKENSSDGREDERNGDLNDFQSLSVEEMFSRLLGLMECRDDEMFGRLHEEMLSEYHRLYYQGIKDRITALNSVNT